MNCMLWPLVEWKTSLHLSKSLAFAHCQIKFAAPARPPLANVIFLARSTLRIRSVARWVLLFFAPLLWWLFRVSRLARLFIIIVKLTLGDVPKSNLILNWQSEADTANLPANLICRDTERDRESERKGSQSREWANNWIANLLSKVFLIFFTGLNSTRFCFIHCHLKYRKSFVSWYKSCSFATCLWLYT